MKRCINLNADLGESFGAYSMGDDAALMPIINSANIACGFHAGDPSVMRKAVSLAQACKVSLGAHPSFPDLQGFGRRAMQVSKQELIDLLHYQMGALQGIAYAQGATITHIKPHGALNNMACEDEVLAQHIAEAVHTMRGDLILLAPACSHLVSAGKAAGLLVAEEVFADRAYQDNGALVPRSMPGAVIHSAEECAQRVVSFLRAGAIITQSGRYLSTPIDSVCVHADTPDSVAIARTIKETLEAEGFTLTSLPDMAL